MATPASTPAPPAGGHAVPPPTEQDLFAFLRYSHIFASVVRDVLELQVLRELEPDNLTLSQFHLLKLIALNGTHQVGEVADFLGVSAPAASKNIDKLEGLGLVARRPSPGDRRAILLSSSRRGREFVERYETLKEERMAPVLAAFQPEEINQLARLMERFSLLAIKHSRGQDGLCFRCSAYYQDNCPVMHLQDGCPYQRLRAPRSGGGDGKEAGAPT